ncbi:MAG: ATP synthase F1 subunit delta [Bacteroidia bacterium]|nr:MAG: ATP synthase F1 subunit delta [Bacteroidia bacterium]
MNTNRISVRYAKALFEAAKEEKNIKEIAENMEQILSASRIKDFKNFLETPVVQAGGKQKIFHSLFGQKFNSLTLKFFKLLSKNNREAYLPLIAANYIKYYKEHFNIKSAQITTAYSADKDLHEEIKTLVEKLYGKNTQADVQIQTDKNLIGGFVLNIDHKQYDASISAKLKKIKNTLLNSSISEQ